MHLVVHGSSLVCPLRLKILKLFACTLVAAYDKLFEICHLYRIFTFQIIIVGSRHRVGIVSACHHHQLHPVGPIIVVALDGTAHNVGCSVGIGEHLIRYFKLVGVACRRTTHAFYFYLLRTPVSDVTQIFNQRNITLHPPISNIGESCCFVVQQCNILLLVCNFRHTFLNIVTLLTIVL